MTGATGETRPLEKSEVKKVLGWRAILGAGGPPDEAEFARAQKLYDDGQYVPALNVYKPLAACGHPGALHCMGCIYDFGNGVREDKALAQWYYGLAADRGHAAAHFDIGVSYKTGDGVPVNYEVAFKHYERALELGHLPAKNALANLYMTGDGVAKDRARGLALFREAAAEGDANAYYSLATYLDDKEATEAEKAEALTWLKRAADENVENAVFAYKVKLYNGETDHMTPEAALAQLQARAEKYVYPELMLLGMKYMNGDGVEKDVQQAFGLFCLTFGLHCENPKVDNVAMFRLVEAARAKLDDAGVEAGRALVLEKGGPNALRRIAFAFRVVLGEAESTEEDIAWSELATEADGKVNRYIGNGYMLDLG